MNDAPKAVSSTSDTVAKLDLKKYRTGELVQQITELISIPGAFIQVLFTAIITIFVVMISVVAIAFFSEFSGLSWMIVCAYALLAGACLGILLGILRVIYRGLGNIEAILNLVLGVARQAANGSGRLQSGAFRAPSGAELVAQVYDDVFAPCLEKAVEGAFGWLGTPVLWLYRRTIGASVRFMIKRVPKPELTPETEGKIQDHFESGIVGTAKYADMIESYTASASGVVNSIGGGIRNYIMRPMFFLFCVLMLVAALPILIYRFWAGWVATPNTEEFINEVVTEAISTLF